ncbi:enoyl-CoA hydratase/isomerase family protein [Actinophytocola gossypii]|uniref:Enoyl-CoA hydratase/isomerase family protein n=1 Tax=Actinophytocola gossypii TaxID=2812003 RepID=A0ABT2J6N4_9PSEU|nr:enoyl-CoA hydratase-related protein [Actinophytocola gossypii]MCT2583522.1 enoyl-CoA hydratase/isomerase family protein [Actinophytocola gossypii]
MTNDPDAVLLERSDGVATITLNRPRVKNAMTWDGWTGLRDAVRAIDPLTDRVVVVTGAGEDFCAGADLTGPATGGHQVDDMRIVGDACLALHRLPIPTIARVDGVAVGAGMNLALVCDFVVAAARARFSEIFVKRAMSVDFGGSWLLPRLVGLRRAKELVLLGDIIDAAKADELGLLHRVVEPADLDKVVAELADRLAAGPRLAMAGSKALLNDAFDVTLERALDEEARAQAVSVSSPDAAEAIEAFLHKRTPDFRRSGTTNEEER